MIDIGNCAYLDDVSMDIAEQFQQDNPHVTVFYQGLPLGGAEDHIRLRASCDFDAQKRARHRKAAGIPVGTVGYLFDAKVSETRH